MSTLVPDRAIICATERPTAAKSDVSVATVEVGLGRCTSEANETSPSLRPVGTFHVIVPPEVCSSILDIAQ